jgi:zinc transporter 2
MFLVFAATTMTYTLLFRYISSIYRMATVLHGRSCHHHNHSHEQHNVNAGGSDSKWRGRLSGDDEMKASTELQIDVDDKDKTIQSEVENINVQAARLHVLGDFLQSVGVIVAAVIIKIYVSR